MINEVDHQKLVTSTAHQQTTFQAVLRSAIPSKVTSTKLFSTAWSQFSKMPEPNSILATLSTAFTLSLKVTEKVYEIVAVDEEARNLLETTAQISRQITYGKKLRRQRSGILSSDEKAMVDQVFESTEQAVNTVVTLVEPARADMEVSGGRVRLSTRMVFVFRDLAHIPVSLSKLGIAGSSLNMVISMLNSKESAQRLSTPDTHSPPTYRESEWLYAKRQKNLQRRASALKLQPQSPKPHAPLSSSSSSIAEAAEDAGSVCDSETTITVPEALCVPPSLRVHNDQAQQSFLPSIRVTQEERISRRLTGRARNRSWLQYQAEKMQ